MKHSWSNGGTCCEEDWTQRDQLRGWCDCLGKCYKGQNEDRSVANLIIIHNLSLLWIRFIHSSLLLCDYVVKLINVGNTDLHHFTDVGLGYRLALDNAVWIKMTMCQFQMEALRGITDFYSPACFFAIAKIRASLGSCCPFSLGSRINTSGADLRPMLSGDKSSQICSLK